MLEYKNPWFLPSWSLQFSMALVSEPIKHPFGCLCTRWVHLAFLCSCCSSHLQMPSAYFNSASISTPSSFVKTSLSITAVYFDFFLLWATVLLGALLNMKPYHLSTAGKCPQVITLLDYDLAVDRDVPSFCHISHSTTLSSLSAYTPSLMLDYLKISIKEAAFYFSES